MKGACMLIIFVIITLKNDECYHVNYLANVRIALMNLVWLSLTEIIIIFIVA